ncbi:PID-CTERM protein-sorting domain-containing protein [Polaribacter marinaquae]|uniref:XapX domain-containing protein n=1 Tax=Polaribacter marinaquae TaxID=1642819 RepID=A0ABZ2TMU8_9FLAO
MKKIKYLVLIIVLLSTQLVCGQMVPPPPPGLSVDGGVIFLLASALIYGVAKLRN